MLASAVFFSLSGILTKAIDADSWTILAWRGVIGGAGLGGYVWFRRRREPLRQVFRLGRDGWLLVIVGGIGSITFITAFKNTLVANVSVIYASIPFIAAVLERAVLGTAVRRQTLVAAGASVLGVLVIVSGDGLCYEVLNGLMSREDREEALKIPLGIVPGGSGNALAAGIMHACK